MALGNDVVNLESKIGISFREVTILAMTMCAATHKRGETAFHLASLAFGNAMGALALSMETMLPISP